MKMGLSVGRWYFEWYRWCRVAIFRGPGSSKSRAEGRIFRIGPFQVGLHWWAKS